MDNAKSEEKKNGKNKRNDWFYKAEDPGPDSDLRILLYEMLKECLGMATYNGEITWNRWKSTVPSRPFINKFKEKKKGDRVFTDSVTANFIFLCANRSEYGNDKIKVCRDHWLNKAADIIHKSKFGKAVSSPDNQSILCDECDFFNCAEAMRTGEFSKPDSGYHSCEKCRKCLVLWMYSSFNFIEMNYWSIINDSINILYDFTDDKHRQTIDDAYQSIKRFELKPSQELCSLDRLIELYNKCNDCFEYPDVADEKIAYIKWFTARLCNWPYFKTKLIEINRYNEEWIHYLLNSASDILRTAESTDEKLISRVGGDKLISYLTLGYMRPFSLTHYEQPEVIASKCLKAIEQVSVPENKLTLYIELLNFRYQTDPKYTDRCDTLILELFSKCDISAEILLLRVRYELYTFLYNLSSKEQKHKVGNAINSAYCFFNQSGMIPESLDFMTEVFFEYYEKYAADEFFNSNPAAVMCDLKGCSSINDVIFSQPQNPCIFQRIFGDYVMPQYYHLRYNSIVSHFESTKNNTDNDRRRRICTI